MGTRAAKKNAVQETDDPRFAGRVGPHSHQAQAITEREELARKKAREEQMRIREATHPHLPSNLPTRPDTLRIPEKAKAALAKRNLQIGWVRKEEVREYLSQGFVLATLEDVGGEMPISGYGDDPSAPMTSIVERRDDIVALVYPISWEKERQKAEQHRDKLQRDVDPYADAGHGRRKRGSFGARQRQPLGLYEDEDEEDEE